MGCGGTKFVPGKTKGQGEHALVIALKLGLSRIDVDRMWGAFKRFDLQNDGTVSISEFIVVERLEQAEIFGKMAFRLWDDDCSGLLDFTEFMCAVWALASADHGNLAAFTHSLFDFDGSGDLDAEELAFIGNLIWQFRPSPGAQTAIAHLDKDHDGSVTRSEFIERVKHSGVILQPAFEVLHFLQSFTLGIPRWESLSQTRRKQHGTNTIFEILHVDRLEEKRMKAASLNVAREEAAGHDIPGKIQKKLTAAHSMYEKNKETLAEFRKEALRLQNEGSQLAFTAEGKRVGFSSGAHYGAALSKTVSEHEVTHQLNMNALQRERALEDMKPKAAFNKTSAAVALYQMFSGTAPVYAGDTSGSSLNSSSGNTHTRRPSLDHHPAKDEHHKPIPGHEHSSSGNTRTRRPSLDHHPAKDEHHALSHGHVH